MLPVTETARRLRMNACLDKILVKQRLRLLTFNDTSQKPLPTCNSCRYYFGLTYGGHLLVCSVHPAGPLTKPCPDWEYYNPL